MSETRTIDVHAHVLSEETMRLLQRESAELAPRLSEIGSEGACLQVAGITQRPFPRGAWDLDKRLHDMDLHGVDVQVVSVCPQTFLYDQDPALTASFAAIQNEQISALVAAMPDRFMGLATLPLQAPERAAAELRRAMLDLGLVGALIGSHVEGRNLDDPNLEPVWAAAAELGAFILVHPQKVAAAKRLGAYYLTNLIGNPLETSIAAASLVFAGVLERYPTLKVCFAHGGGFIPYQAGRLMHGWEVRPEAKKRLVTSPEASLRRLYFDTILHFDPALEFLIDTFGAAHVLLGSDYPFDMGHLDCVRQIRELPILDADCRLILGDGARALLREGRAAGACGRLAAPDAHAPIMS